MPTLLVVDDEPNVLYSVEKALRSEGLEILAASTGRHGLDLVQRCRPDAVLLDVRLTDMSGLDVFDQIRHLDPRLPVIVMTAFTTTETAIEATKRGAFEYLLKPVDFHQLRAAVGRAVAVNRLARVPAVFGGDDRAEGDVDRIVGNSLAMQEVYKAIGRLAPQDVTVLILGESGTGKELVARALYQHSRRAGAAFVAINCAAIPEGLLESELFGHEKGAFTGADRLRVGKFEQASGGTLFLDEVGDLTPAAQAKVLRLLQERRFERVGGNQTIQADVRVLAATNQDLSAAVTAGRFRQDLLYRLNGFTVRLPPLRERRADIPALVEHFVQLSNRELGRHVQSVAPEALRLLEGHGWPGNVRELQSTVRFAVVHAEGAALTPGCLPEGLRASPLQAPCEEPDLGATSSEGNLQEVVGRFITDLLRAGEPEAYRQVCLEVDRAVMEATLRHTRGNQGQASELLGISRTTLRARLRALGMVVERQILPGSGRIG